MAWRMHGVAKEMNKHPLYFTGKKGEQTNPACEVKPQDFSSLRGRHTRREVCYTGPTLPPKPPLPPSGDAGTVDPELQGCYGGRLLRSPGHSVPTAVLGYLNADRQASSQCV